MNGRIDFHDICSTYSLPDVAGHYGVALKRTGREWIGCCPFHSEKTPSFTIYDTKDRERFKCFGCGETGDVITFVEKMHSCTTREAIEILDHKNIAQPTRPRMAPLPAANDFSDPEKIGKARSLWHKAKPAAGTIVEQYLLNRGIALEKIGGVPRSLRFDLIDYWHPRQGQSRPEKIGTFPAMLAPIQQKDGSISGVHITYLDEKTATKISIADPDDAKRFLKAKKMRGQMQGGCIRLGPAGEKILIAEGIETALSVKTAIVGTPHDATVWTCLALSNLGAVRLPDTIKNVVVLADNDMKIPTSERQVDPRKYLIASAKKMVGLGVAVRVAWPPMGMDFNDLLLQELNKK